MNTVRNCNQNGSTLFTSCSGLDSTWCILTRHHMGRRQLSSDCSILSCAIDTTAVGVCMNAAVQVMQERTLKSVLLHLLEFRLE